MENIKKQINILEERLPKGSVLVAVSKNHSVEKIQQVYGLGCRIFGENKVQELVNKYNLLPKDIEWHMIGHLQTNKAKYIAPFIDLIHSIDSYKLLQEVNKQATKVNRVIKCLLQVCIAKEETKYGLPPSQLGNILKKSRLLENINIVGLMGMATNTSDVEQIRKEFTTLRELHDSLKNTYSSMEVISMGMSGDYKTALECGSTMIRVGSLIFGKRNYNNS